MCVISSDNNDKMSLTNQIYPKEHNHTMVYAGTHYNHCETVVIYSCSDQECGEWTSTSTYDPSGCNMRVTKFSTRVTCSECTKCGKKSIDHS